uniref:Uncharacterized protein n=1 Tax=Hyaloperonospora arabidopsidis (strain Emoy2) TaxID=559515 RepID=M4C6E8_HYAAE
MLSIGVLKASVTFSLVLALLCACYARVSTYSSVAFAVMNPVPAVEAVQLYGE